MQAGKMRHRVQFLKPTRLVTTTGDEEITYVHDFYLWASFEPLSGRELWYAQQVRSDVTHTIGTRYTARILPGHRFVYSGRTFECGPTWSPQEKRFESNMTAVELVSGG